jgi:hypothetical protein
MNEPKKPNDIIKQAMKTEMDRRLDLMREYLLMQEKMTPLAKFEYRRLMIRLNWMDEDDYRNEYKND